MNTPNLLEPDVSQVRRLACVTGSTCSLPAAPVPASASSRLPLLQVSKLLSNPKGRAQVLTFRSMYVMADLGDEGDVSGANCKVRGGRGGGMGGGRNCVCRGRTRKYLRRHTVGSHVGLPSCLNAQHMHPMPCTKVEHTQSLAQPVRCGASSLRTHIHTHVPTRSLPGAGVGARVPGRLIRHVPGLLAARLQVPLRGRPR